MGRLLRMALLAPFLRRQMKDLTIAITAAHLQALNDLFEAGALTPVIDRRYPLQEVAEALRYVATGHARAKVAITVAAPDAEEM